MRRWCFALVLGVLLSSSLLSLVVAQSYGDAAVAALLASANARPPVFALNFTVNPASLIGVTPAYNWSLTDPLDSSSVSAYHQGVVLLSGGSSSYVDLSNAGANYAGSSLPTIGGSGFYSVGTAGQGWTFEVVFKVNSVVVSGWPKVFFLGNGAGVDDLVVTWNGNDAGRLALQTYNNATAFPQWNYAIKNAIQNPQPGQWYHMVWEIVAYNATAGSGNWYLWLNGQQQAFSGGIVPQAIYTWLQGATTPAAVPRTQSYLGKSDFTDPDAAVTIDAFRIYDYALPQSTVQLLANAYGLNLSTPGNSSYAFGVSAEQQAANGVVSRPPIFSATFSQNPASVVGGTLNYIWNTSDPADSPAVQAYHQGVVILSGATNSYIDLTKTWGPYSCGQLLPVFGGPGNGTYGSTQGVTFEMVVKLYVSEVWSKLFNFGTGGGIDTMGLSWNGNNGQTGTVEVQNYNNIGGSPVNGAALIESQMIALTPSLNTWYHLALVMVNTDPVTYTSASWTFYVNGVATANLTNANLPLAVYRPYSYIAASDWGDVPTAMAVDAFRIYDYALSQGAVQRLAALYGLNGTTQGPATLSNVSYNFPLSTEDVQTLAVVPIPPLFRASFPINPSLAVGTPTSSLNYQWLQSDPTDPSSIQSAHQGLIRINGASSSYIDLQTSQGPNSVGLVLPQIGGAGYYPWGAAQQGWTFETVVKFNQTATSGQWPKVWFLGNGAGVDDIVISWNGNDIAGLGLQMYSNATINPQYQYGYVEITRPVVLNTWYHIVWTVQAAPVPQQPQSNLTAGAGVWQCWINGQLLNWASQVNNGGTLTYSTAIYTPVQGANYPQYVSRTQSYIAKSDYNDPFLALTLDAFRIYNYTLTTQQVQALAAIYLLNTSLPSTTSTPIWPIPAPQPLPQTSETTNYQGITQQPPVFNAVFGQDPKPYIGGTEGYQWAQQDPADTGVVAQAHQGILILNGSATAYIDLTQVTGPNSIGLTLPIICTPTVIQSSTTGCTIELVVKLTAVVTWEKLLDFGTGGYSDSLALSWNSNLGNIEVQNYNKVPGYGASSSDPSASLPFLTPVIGQWYHIALVMQPAGPVWSYAATYLVYVNGVPVASLSAAQGAQMPMPVFRNDAYLGGSDWTDAPIPANFDMLRVYNYALSETEVQGMAQVYQLYNSTGFDLGLKGDAAVNYILSSTNSRPPVFALNFTVNPASLIGVTPAYNWSLTDPLDSSSVSAYHQGVVLLSGGSSSYVDLSNAGANYAGSSLPTIGGSGFYSVGTAGQGWTFEVVFKVNSVVVSGWPKVFFLGNGAGVDDLVVTWNGNDAGRLALQTYNNATAFPQWNYAIKNAIQNPQPGQWYHMVWEIVAYNATAGSGNWYLWLNGQQQAFSGGIVPQAIYTWLQGATTPAAVPRTQSYLGKSDFTDPDAAVTIDAFRIYDYALPSSTITMLAGAYNLALPVATNQSYPFNTSAEQQAANAAVARPPIFSATFSQNPAPVVGGTLNYIWNTSDPADSPAVQAYHQGVVILNGATNSYIDLTKTWGLYSCGQLLPVFGGPGSGYYPYNQGVTFEMVVKLYVSEVWSKLFNFGTGGGIDTMGLSWNGNSGQTGTVEVQNYNNIGGSPVNGAALIESQMIALTPSLNTWYHLALVMVNTDPVTYTSASWTFYVNGVATANLTNANLPLAVYRPYSYIAASDWGDVPTAMAVDAFRIYDYALSQGAVQRLAALYGLNGTTQGPATLSNVSYNFPLSTEDVQTLAVVPIPPLFRASFPINPSLAVGTPTSSLNYQWLQSDPTDPSSIQSAHQGLIRINGASSSYIDLQTSQGPNSVGLVLPQIGGAGYYPWGAAQQGWTFETVVKFNQTATSGQWPKVWFLGNGAGVDDIVISWNGNDIAGLGLQMYSNATINPQYQYGYVEITRPVVLNTWYHIVWTVQAAPVPQQPQSNLTAGAGVWQCWINGQLLNWASQVNNGGTLTYSTAIYTPVQGANYPQYVSRTQSYIAKSDYNDPFLALTLDAFRIYNYTLTTQQVQALAAIYLLNTSLPSTTSTPIWPIPAPQPLPQTSETTNYQGITQQPPVFNAVFGQDPKPYIGGTEGYQWAQQDPADTGVVAQAHQGILILNGSATAYIDLTQVTGPNSIGLTLPIICSPTNGAATPGCTVEMVVKLTSVVTWEKVFDFGTGGYSDSLAISWNSNLGNIEVQNYNKVPGYGASSSDPSASLPFLTPTIGQWYHIALVMTPQTPLYTYAATYTAYVNGVVVATMTPAQGAQMPMPVFRNDAYLGGSDWTDAPIPANFDMFRVYGYSMAASEILKMASVYGLATAPTEGSSAPTQSSTAAVTSAAAPGVTSTVAVSSSTGSRSRTSSPSMASSVSAAVPPSGGGSSSSSLSGGAIAGIVIGSVVGALILCCILFLAFCWKGGKSKETPPPNIEQMGHRVGKGYGEVESSALQTNDESKVQEDEVEMAPVDGETGSH